MTVRFTQTEKWDDTWFRKLSPNAKVLYWYIWDKCNIAGFWEIDLEGAVFHTKIPKRSIEGAYKELARGFETNGNYVWVRRFLYHQKNLPLNPENPAHKGILRLIEEYKSLFPNILQLLEAQLIKEKTEGATKGLPSSLSISKGTSKSTGTSKPSQDFEKFWQAYPKRWVESSHRWVKVGKYDAWLEWQKLTADEQKIVLEVVSWVPAGMATPDAFRWLKHRRWEDYGKEPVKPEPKPKPKEPQVKIATKEQRIKARKRLPLSVQKTLEVKDKANEQKEG